MVFELATEKAVEETEGSKETFAQIGQLDVANGYVKIICWKWRINVIASH